MKKQAIKFFSGIFPNTFTNLAYRNLTSPQVRKLRTHELDVLDQAKQEDIEFKGFRIRTYHWQGKGEKVMLIHGWEGQAGNFADLIAMLRQHNFDVYAFDAPSHGFSSMGSTSLFEFTELVGLLLRKWEAKKLVSHSFGGVATTYALFSNTDIQIERYALLTTPDKFTERIDDVAAQVGIHQKVKTKLINRLEEEIQLDVSSLNVSRFVQAIQVQKSLIIHDKNDRVIPLEQSMNVHKNWEVSDLETIEGTRHFRILRTPKVLNRVIEFLQS